MTQEFRDLTKSYLPTVTVVGMLSGLLIIVWFVATKTAEIAQIRENQKDMAAQMRDVPTRTEYNILTASISEVKTAIDNLGKELRAKK